MKKVSTRAAAQRRNISQQKLTIGLDLGDRNSWYCVVDETGQIKLDELRKSLQSEIDHQITIWVNLARVTMLSLFGQHEEVHAALNQCSLVAK